MPVVFAVLPFFSTFLGGVAALRFQHRLHPLMALAAGMVVATALADLLPEAAELMGEDVGRLPVAAAVITGYLAFSLVDALIHAQNWERQHTGHDDDLDPMKLGPAESTAPASPLGLTRSAGMILHSLLDGVAIGLGFHANSELGLLVGIAVLTHDFADGMNVVTLALAAGHGIWTARIVLTLDAVAPAVGVAIGSLVPLSSAVLGALLAAFAGVFLAIGAGHLLPEAQHRRPGGAPYLVLIAAVGAGVVLAIQSTLGG